MIISLRLSNEMVIFCFVYLAQDCLKSDISKGVIFQYHQGVVTHFGH